MRNICTVVLKKNISADWYKSGEWLGCRYFRGWRVWGENYEIQDWNDNENKLSRPRWCAKGIWKDTFSRLIFVMVAIRKTSRMLISMSQRKETQFKCVSFLNCMHLNFQDGCWSWCFLTYGWSRYCCKLQVKEQKLEFIFLYHYPILYLSAEDLDDYVYEEENNTEDEIEGLRWIPNIWTSQMIHVQDCY